MSNRRSFTMKGMRLAVQDANGNMVELNGVVPYSVKASRTLKPIEVRVLSPRELRPIICEPIPGPNGTINYVQDWSDLTRFG